MTRWLLNTFPTWFLFAIVVGGFALVSAIGHRVVHRLWPDLRRGASHELANALMVILIGMYGIVLAFVIVALYEEYKEAQQTVEAEANELSQVYLDTRGLPEDVRDAIDAHIVAYVEILETEEWPLMERGEGSHEAEAELEELYVVLQGYEPDTVAQETFYAEAVSRLNDLMASRRDRLEFAEQSLPTELLVLVVGGAVVLIGFMFFFGAEEARGQALMFTAVGAAVGFSLFVVVTLDHPFSGDVTVSPHVFEEGVLEHLFE
ncbi:MAG: DUF4239 domain-containing protein [Actinomycetota bacterium]